MLLSVLLLLGENWCSLSCVSVFHLWFSWQGALSFSFIQETSKFNASCIDSFRPYLLPPTPSSGPASPCVSDQESASDVDEQANQKGADDEGEEVKKGK